MQSLDGGCQQSLGGDVCMLLAYHRENLGGPQCCDLTSQPRCESQTEPALERRTPRACGTPTNVCPTFISGFQYALIRGPGILVKREEVTL